MAQQREATSDLAAFYKWKQPGEALAGLVSKTGKNDNGEFIIFHPCITRETFGGQWERDDDFAVGLTTDLGMKLDRKRDEGKYFAIEFVELEPTKRGQPKKLFRVTELNRDEIIALRDATAEVLPPFTPKVKTADSTPALSDDF